MLLRIESFRDVDCRSLMDIYEESNLENTSFFCPDIGDSEEAKKTVENGFLGYLENEFLPQSGNCIYVLEEDGIWLCALRLSHIKDEIYYIEALETRPDSRRKGWGSRLLLSMIDEMKKGGDFTLCDCVSKNNEASVRTHLKCGFSLVSSEGWNYLENTSDSRDYSMRYEYRC